MNDAIGYHLKKTNLCDLALMNERFIPTWELFALPKKNPYFYLIDEGKSLNYVLVCNKLIMLIGFVNFRISLTLMRFRLVLHEKS